MVILHIPILNLQNPKPLYYQTVHGKRIIGGYEAEQRLLPVAEDLIMSSSFLRSIHIDAARHKTAITQEEASDALRLFEAYPRDRVRGPREESHRLARPENSSPEEL